jgi:cytochrome c oxidase subunit 3
MGVFAAEHGRVGRTGSVTNVRGWGMREWFILTYLMGAVFIAGQVTEYASLIHEGVTISSSPYGSVFYLTTGFHGLHVTGGLIAFVFVLARTYMARRFTHEQAVSAIVVSYYWHFVDVVWIALFATIYLLQ